MAIGRISGSVLKSNLTRNGVDLAFETNLLYLDVTNSRIGIGTSEPTTALDVAGTVNATAFVGDGSGLTGINATGDITFTGSTISSPSNADLTLTPGGTGKVVIDGLNYPTADGTNGQVLTTDGAGTLSFTTVGGTTINNNADNRIITGSSTANTLEAESGITFSNNRLTITNQGGLNTVSVNAHNIGNNEFLSLRGGAVSGGIKIQYYSGGWTDAITIDEATDACLFSIPKVIMSNLPISDPGVAGQLWNNSGVLNISAG